MEIYLFLLIPDSIIFDILGRKDEVHMNRKEFVKNVCSYLKDNDMTKPISIPKQVLHISDDEGNKKDFSVKKTDKSVIYTSEDVEGIINACIEVVKDALRNGDNVSIKGFGTIGLNYRKPRRTKQFGTNKDLIIEGRYVPKFAFGNDLRMCAKLYELSLDDRLSDPEPFLNEDEDGGHNGD